MFRKFNPEPFLDLIFLLVGAFVRRPLAHPMVCLTQRCVDHFAEQELADRIKLLINTNDFLSSTSTFPFQGFSFFKTLLFLEILVILVIAIILSKTILL